MPKRRYQFEIPEFCLGKAVGEINRRRGVLLNFLNVVDGVVTVDAEMDPEAHNGYDEWLAELIAKGPNGIQPYCSFCGKGKDEVKTMVQGPAVYICDECVVVCQGIIAGENNDT
jgi:hypothetical protein